MRLTVVIDLRSDTVTRPSKGMYEAMISAPLGDDVFEDDPTVQKLERMVAEMLGEEAALFVPSGTMANEIAVHILTQPGDEILCQRNCHVIRHEAAAAAMISGVQMRPLGTREGMMTAEEIEGEIQGADVHEPVTRAISIETPHTDAGGRLFPFDEMVKISELARRRGLAMHLDGARLWNHHVVTGIPLIEFGRLFDTITVCLSKGLGAPIGSVLAGTTDHIRYARHTRKRLGGGMRQVGILAAAGIYALANNIARIAADHENAKWFAEQLAALGPYRLDPSKVETNSVVFEIDGDEQEFAARLKEKGVLIVWMGRHRLRAMTHLDVTRADLARALEAFSTATGA
jgi:threonine aldolase